MKRKFLIAICVILALTMSTGIAGAGEPAVKSISKITVKSTSVKQVQLSVTVTGASDSKLTGFYAYYNGAAKPKYQYTKDIKTQTSIDVPIPYNKETEIKIAPFYKDESDTVYYSNSKTVTVTSKKMGTPLIECTKISTGKVKVLLKRATGSDGTQVQYYKSGKWRVAKNVDKDKIAATIRFTNAGKYKYRVRAYSANKYQGKTVYSAACSSVAPQPNVFSWSYTSKLSKYAKKGCYFKPEKVYYKKGIARLKCKFINRYSKDLKKMRLKVKITSEGKPVGRRTISSGKIKANSVKYMTFKLDTKNKGLDLRNGGTGWEQEVLYIIDSRGIKIYEE